MSYPAVDTALRALLNADATLTTYIGAKIYADVASAGAALPYIVFYQADGRSGNVCSRDTINYIYRVETRRGVDQASTVATAKQIHAQVKAVLHNKTLTITGWTNYLMMVEEEKKFTENFKGKDTHRFIWDVRIRASED